MLGPGLDSLLRSRAQETPDRLAACFPDQRLTYRELEERAFDLARRLHHAGVRPGDRVGILLGGCPDYVALLFAVAKLNAIAVAINARYKEHELRYVAQHAGLALLVAGPEYAGLAHEAGVGELCAIVDPGDQEAFAAGPPQTAQAVEEVNAAIAGDEPALMLYTSGTTASPKGCLHGHRGLLAQAENFATRLQLTEDDRFWTPLPLFHIGGITVLLASLFARAPFVHVGFFEAGAAVKQLEAERCTVAFPAFETIWMAVTGHERFATADLSSLRLVVAIGIAERLRQMQERVPWAIQVSATGSTESGGFLCLGSQDDPLEARITTSGAAVDGMEVRVVDPETGLDVPPGTDGELLFRGVSRFLRYHEDAEATAASIDDGGWFHSGDQVRADGAGRITYVGRYKDMLKVGGENVAAAEIEDYLARHEAVAVVQVVSAPDARYAEVAAAYVQLRDGATCSEQELIDFCVGRISTFKVPRYVRFVDDWPFAGNKIQKHVLRTRIAEELAAAGITEAPRIQATRT
jgi:fatty-acyl-CoA synthase